MLGVMRVRFIFLLVGLVFSVSAFSEDKVVMQHGATTILQSDIVSAVQSFVPPDKVLAVFSDEKKVRDTVARLFIHRKLAEDAAAPGDSHGRALRHHRDEGQAQQLGEVGLADGGGAGRRLDDGGARPDQPVAQAVEEQRACQPVLQAA